MMKTRVLDAVRREPSPTRADLARSAALRIVLAAISCAVVLVTWGGIRAGGMNEGLHVARPNVLLVATTLGAAAMTGFATWAAISRGRSMRGRRLEWLAAVAILTPLALLAWKTGVSAAFDGM